jgi:hypothetical protein
VYTENQFDRWEREDQEEINVQKLAFHDYLTEVRLNLCDKLSEEATAARYKESQKLKLTLKKIRQYFVDYALVAISGPSIFSNQICIVMSCKEDLLEVHTKYLNKNFPQAKIFYAPNPKT